MINDLPASERDEQHLKNPNIRLPEVGSMAAGDASEKQLHKNESFTIGLGLT